MPAINVAKTDTFETQRQKINQIGDQIFNISQGGSDLATGNLKLGDGTRTSPSLAFTSDASLGIYKPEEKTIGYVSSGRKIADFAPSAFYSFRDLIVQRKILSNSGISVNNFGENYDAGNYTDVPILGGTGEDALASIQVIEYEGTITNSGENYIEGDYTNVELSGGSGSGAVSSFTVEGINGNITNAGSGYIPGTYNNVSLINGTGTGATANLVISGDTVLTGVISNAGSGYTTGSYSQVELLNVPTTTYAVTTVSNPGTPPPDNVYQIDGNTQQVLTLIKGNTYRFDISDSSMDGHPFIFQALSGNPLNPDYYVVTSRGSAGTANSFIDLIIKSTAPTETIKYNCSAHDGMGANISIVSGSTGNYGNGATVTITVNSSNQISNVEFINSGFDYKLNDTLQVYSDSIGGSGSGFIYTLNQPTYTGIISSIDIQSNGIDYLKNDILSVSNSSVGGFGSGFEYIITTDPGIIKNFSFTERGDGYLVNDLLSLPSSVTGVSTNLKGEVVGVTTTLDTNSAIITVSSTSGIVEGMNVIVTSFDPFNPGASGNLPPQTTVLSVDSSTQITLSDNPSANGSSTLTFRSPGILTEIIVSSTLGIFPGYSVNQTAGSGIISPNTTVSSVNSLTNIIELSLPPNLAGSATLSFSPPFGLGTQQFEYEINTLGVIDSFNITNGGNGYSVSDQLTVNETDLVQPITYNVLNRPVQRISFSSTLPSSTFSVGDIIQVADGSIETFSTTSSPSTTQTVIPDISTTLSNSSAIITVPSTTGILQGMLVTQGVSDTGILTLNTTVLSVDSSTQITLSAIPSTSGSANLTFSTDESGTFTNIISTTDGSGINATFDITRSTNGSIQSVTINNIGLFYESEDTVTIDGSLIGGETSTHDIVLTLNQTSSTQASVIRQKVLTDSNIESLLVDFVNFRPSDLIVKENTTTTYELDTASLIQYKYYIDLNDGNGFQLTPDFTLYSGSTYVFDLSDSSNNGHVFSLSSFRDGIWGPSYIQNISTTLSTNSLIITLADTTGILPGMLVTVESGEGTLLPNTTVVEVTNSTVTLSNPASTSGAAFLTFRGVEYTDGVSRGENDLTIKISDTTPNLYYYCSTSEIHQNEGGDDNVEALITIDNNNPKIFGSGFLASVLEVSSSDLIKASISTGDLEAVKIITNEGEINNLTVGSLTAPSISGDSIIVSTVTSSNLSISSPNTIISGNLNIGSNININNSTGNITTAGILKTTGSLNVNDILTISNNTISTSSENNILLSPPVGRIAKIVSTGALTIPSGTTSQRPTTNIVENGSIRFNTDTNQYEGYSETSSSWSSLGGVRDLDGNTFILAEESIGSNDNTLWFINDNINTVRFTPQYQEFVNVKKIRSVNTSAPDYVNWTANTPVDVGDYLKYRNNIFEVTIAGTTAASGNEPTNTTGNPFANGTATLQYFTTAVAQLTFEEISQLNIDPLGFTDLVVNGELRFSNNVISTNISDLVIQPNSGQKVSINSNTSLAIPVGDSNSRGNAAQGSIRFNTTISQYEGYDGTNWSSLGGVRDVDGNTYIIPELSAGSNENILYFYNNGSNTLRVTQNNIQFDTIDTINSQTSNTLNINASTITFDSLSTTLDNTSATETFLFTTKDNFDIGLSAGLTTDPVLRITDVGDIFYNIGYGTGTFSGIKLFNQDLNEFELADYKVVTDKSSLLKGTINQGSTNIYNPSIQESAKVQIIAHNTTTGDKEFIEYSVIDNTTDIFHTEFGNVKTGADLITTLFDFNASNEVRITYILDDAISNGDSVEVTVVSNIIKR